MSTFFGGAILGAIIGGFIYTNHRIKEVESCVLQLAEIQKDLLEIEVQEQVDDSFEDIVERFDEP